MPDERARVSVVVPHYGPVEQTDRLLACLRAQDLPGLEVVVVDDRGPDPMPDRPGVVVVRRPANGGFGAAVNSGAAASTGVHLLIVNSDVTFEPSFVRRFLEVAESLPPALCGPAVVTGGEPETTARRFPTIGHQVVEWLAVPPSLRRRPGVLRATGLDVDVPLDGVSPVDWVAGVVMLLPLADFAAVGGFDEQFHMYVEEIDLQRRLRDHGLARFYVGTVSVEHVGFGSSPVGSRRGWMAASRMRYAAKWSSPARLRLALTATTALNLLLNATRRIAGRDIAPVDVAREELALIWTSKLREGDSGG